MLPADGALLSPERSGPFIGGRNDNRVGRLHDYESGGVALNDASRGLLYQVWHSWTDGSRVFTQPASGAPIELMADSGITEVSVSFDQNMSPCVAYVAGGIAKLWWYDPLAGEHVTVSFAGAVSPRVALDDKRPQASAGGWNDVVLAYVRAGAVYIRYQRERFQTGHFFALANSEIIKIGMNKFQCFQFLMRA